VDAERVLQHAVSDRERLDRRSSSRDALHVAVVGREGVHRIMSSARAFDGMRGIDRLG
jgi:hypothetical protein